MFLFLYVHHRDFIWKAFEYLIYIIKFIQKMIYILDQTLLDQTIDILK